MCFEQNISNGTWYQFSKALLHKFTLPHKLARQNLFQYNKITSAKYLSHPTVLSNNTTNKNYIRNTTIKSINNVLPTGYGASTKIWKTLNGEIFPNAKEIKCDPTCTRRRVCKRPAMTSQREHLQRRHKVEQSSSLSI